MGIPILHERNDVNPDRADKWAKRRSGGRGMGMEAL